MGLKNVRKFENKFYNVHNVHIHVKKRKKAENINKIKIEKTKCKRNR
jgi:hypothetical protein